jgi:hypothetical protein
VNPWQLCPVPDAKLVNVAFSAEVHPMAIAKKMKVLICMMMDRVCEGNTRHTNTKHTGGGGLSGAGQHKAAGGARLGIAMGTATHKQLLGGCDRRARKESFEILPPFCPRGTLERPC